MHPLIQRQSMEMSDMKTIRWGILGPGVISTKFATGLQSAEAAQLVAVGSRSGRRAEKFAADFGAARSYASYPELAADPEVSRFAGQTLSSWQLAKEYGFTDVDGERPDWGSYMAEHIYGES